MAAALFFLPFPTAFTSNGLPAAGAKAFFYTSGTLVPRDTFTSDALTTVHPNPVVADGAGRIPTIYLDSAVTYRLIIKDENDVTLSDIDPYIPGTAAGAELLAPYSATLAGTGGAALVGGTSPSGVLTILQRHIVRNYLEDISGFAEGAGANAANNATALNAAIAAGGHYHMRPGALYRIGARIAFPSNSGLIFEGSHRPTIYMPAANFNRATLDSGTRYGTNAVGLSVAGVTTGYNGTPVDNVTLANFILESEVNGDRSITGISLRNATDVVLDNIEMFGFPLGAGISVQSVRGRSQIRNIDIHDFYSDTVVPALTSGTPNSTGIYVGGDEILASVDVKVPTDGVLFQNIRMDNIATGAAFIAANGGEQSDGLNVAGKDTVNCKFVNLDIRNVAEGIDCFGISNQFSNLYIENARYYGIKLIHGASQNQFNNTRIKNAGIGGIEISGGNDRDVDRNSFYATEIDGIDPNDLWTGADTFGVRLQGTGTYRPKNNLFFGLRINGASKADFGWLDISTGSNNYALDLSVANVIANRVLVSAGGGAVREQQGTGFATNKAAAADYNADLTTSGLTSTGQIRSSSASAGIGYAAGAGGIVTQATNKATAVTLNRPCGQINMRNDALGAGVSVTFVLNNSVIAGSDAILAHMSGAGTGAAYRIEVIDVSTGSCSIKVTNISGGSLSEAIRINFAIIKAVAA